MGPSIGGGYGGDGSRGDRSRSHPDRTGDRRGDRTPIEGRSKPIEGRSNPTKFTAHGLQVAFSSAMAAAFFRLILQPGRPSGFGKCRILWTCWKLGKTRKSGKPPRSGHKTMFAE